MACIAWWMQTVTYIARLPEALFLNSYGSNAYEYDERNWDIWWSIFRCSVTPIYYL